MEFFAFLYFSLAQINLKSFVFRVCLQISVGLYYVNCIKPSLENYLQKQKGLGERKNKGKIPQSRKMKINRSLGNSTSGKVWKQQFWSH